MDEITGNEADKAKEQYENLVIELIKEEDLLPSQRNQDYFDVTRKLFLDRGLSQSDHMSWRKNNMVLEMRSLLYERHKAMNPWMYAVYSYEHDFEFDPEPTPSEEFPDFNRQGLEILAAQEFLFRSQEYSPQKNDTGETLQPELENEQIETVEVKLRQGNLVDIEAKDLLASGLCAQEIVEHWKGQNPVYRNKDGQVHDIDLRDRLSRAGSRAKMIWKRKHGDELRLPIRIHLTIVGDWYKYALTEEGRSGAGGGNKYGIIKDEKNI